MADTDSIKSRYIVSDKLVRSRLSSQGRPFVSTRKINLPSWTWELLSLLLSTACVATILLLVGRYNDQPLPTWYYGLTLNGLISLLAVIAKASLIFPVAECISQLKWHWYWNRERPVADFERFDNASRGPWGSLILLCHPRAWNLASFGAILTLIALAIEPSLQQILTYMPTSVSGGHAQVPVSLHYEDLERAQIANYWGQGLSSAMKGTVYGSVLGNMTSNVIEPQCPTGNCTWSPYSSLAVCHACQNLTASSLKFNPNHSRSPIPIPIQAWELPNSLYLSNDSSMGRRDTTQLMQFMTTATDLSAISFKNMDDKEIMHVDSIFFPPQKDATARPQAFECAFYFCVQTYSGQMQSGSFVELVVDSWPSSTTNLSTSTLRSDLQYEMSNKTGGLLRPPQSNVTYTIETTTLNSLRQWIQSIFNKALYDNYSAGTGGCTGLQCDFLLATYTNYLFGTPLDNGKQDVITGPNSAFARVAKSMTTRIRQTSNQSTGASGQALAMQTIVKARWLWAICPVTLLTLGFGFVLWTVVMSARRRVPTWKSSALATLLHQLDDHSYQALAASTTREMEEAAEEHVMAVRSDEDQWLLQGSRKFNAKTNRQA